MKRYLLPLVLLLALPACSLFRSPDVGPAAEAVATLAEIQQAQAAAFRSFAEQARFSDDAAENEAKRRLVLEGILTDRQAYERVRASLDEYLAELGTVDVDTLVGLGKEFYELYRKVRDE